MHPADHLRGSKSNRLKGRKIVLGVTGSIAAVESVRLTRELIRHGADVHVVMSEGACAIITPWALEFASGREVVTEIDGRVQHVAFCGDVPDRVDLLLVAPATANTISKMACGIDDTPVTTFATTALGSGIPVIVVPAMHGSMMRHTIVQENITKLRTVGVDVLAPREEESKAKMPSIDQMVSAVIRAIGKRDLAGSRVLVVAGATEEPVDDIRVVTNRSSGETGIALARAAYERGADVELWLGRSTAQAPAHVDTRRFSTVADLAQLVDDMGEVDIALFPAAVSDYSPRKVAGKIASDGETLSIELTRNPKLIDRARAKTLVGFKAQSGVDDDSLRAESLALIERSGCAFVVANRMDEVIHGSSRVLLIDRDGTPDDVSGTKGEVADLILDRAARSVR